MAGVHMQVDFYLSPAIDPVEYGFEDCGDHWSIRHGIQRSRIAIDKLTRKITYLSLSGMCLATLLRIAADKGIIIEEANNGSRPYRVSLSEEEYKALAEMRAKAAGQGSPTPSESGQ